MNIVWFFYSILIVVLLFISRRKILNRNTGNVRQIIQGHMVYSTTSLRLTNATEERLTNATEELLTNVTEHIVARKESGRNYFENSISSDLGTQESRDLKQLLSLYENVRNISIPANETDAWYEPLVALQRKIIPPYNEFDIELADKEPRVAMATFSVKPWNLWGKPGHGPRGGLMYKDFFKLWQKRKEISGTIAKVNKMFIGAVLRWHADLFDMQIEQTTEILAPYDIVFFLDTPQHRLASNVGI